MNDNNHKLKKPKVTKDILEYLETLYPDRVPPFGTHYEDVCRTMGSVEVVRHLRHIFNEQTKTVLSKD